MISILVRTISVHVPGGVLNLCIVIQWTTLIETLQTHFD